MPARRGHQSKGSTAYAASTRGRTKSRAEGSGHCSGVARGSRGSPLPYPWPLDAPHAPGCRLSGPAVCKAARGRDCTGAQFCHLPAVHTRARYSYRVPQFTHLQFGDKGATALVSRRPRELTRAKSSERRLASETCWPACRVPAGVGSGHTGLASCFCGWSRRTQRSVFGGGGPRRARRLATGPFAKERQRAVSMLGPPGRRGRLMRPKGRHEKATEDRGGVHTC